MTVQTVPINSTVQLAKTSHIEYSSIKSSYSIKQIGPEKKNIYIKENWTTFYGPFIHIDNGGGGGGV